MKKINTVLIANRGEIALRVMRTANRLGLRSIAVYSDADADALHVKMADDAVRLGPAPAGESYLHIKRVLAAAVHAGADAIHPGYGFLSENAEFAQGVTDQGMVFVGPNAPAIALMGNKAAAKRHLDATNVPCIPGYNGDDQSDDALITEADRIGYPVMVKAAAGGGGLGMRRVDAAANFLEALATARSEALNAFGSSELILEKTLVAARHVEVQIFADTHGNVVHLGERDCSVQRRNQKVLEESPCPVMTPALRQQMGAAACEVAKSIDYHGAGTVEFLLDADGAFYFLEMNTRLQVEHPVTECVTGFDLVEWQIHVAQGNALPHSQLDIDLTGHAIEARLYAEDPAADFRPSPGKVAQWRGPHGEGVRVDTGIETGSDVSAHYDPMIAKIIAYGPDRATALSRLDRALAQTVCFGIKTNRDFLRHCIANATYANGEATTAFIGELPAQVPPTIPFEVFAALRFDYDAKAAMDRALCVPPALSNWSSMGALQTQYSARCNEDIVPLTVSPNANGSFHIAAAEGNAKTVTVEASDGAYNGRIDELRCAGAFHMMKNGGYIDTGAGVFEFHDASGADSSAADDSDGSTIVAPMHGRITEMCVGVGDAVEEGDRLLVIEAMKMQHPVVAKRAGAVAAIHCALGAQVADGDSIVDIAVDP